MTRPFLQLSAGLMLMAGALACGDLGVVLCIGEDGHLAVEHEHSGHCGQTHDAAGQAHDALPAPDAGAGTCETCGCIDVALGCDTLAHDTKSLTRDHLRKRGARPLFAVGYTRLTQTDVHACPRQVHGATQILVQSLREKRTVVLLV